MQATSTLDRKRLLIVAIFLACLFCLLLLRFYRIQIVEHDKWTKIALSQHQAIEVEPFRRGAFYSNTSIKQGHPEDEQPFVIDVIKFHLFIDPESISEAVREKIIQGIAPFFHWTKEDLQWVREEFSKKSRSRKIASWIERANKEKIEAWWTQFWKKEKVVRNALFWKSDYQRSYPFGTMLGTVLHTVQDGKDPKTGQAIPTGGLELLLNNYLKGRAGKRQILRSPYHPIDSGTLLEAPEDGADVYLTVNHFLQAIVESELVKGVQAAKAKGGWAVMMDPYSGEILALAQTPAFDPARYQDFYNDPAKQEWTKVRLVTDCFEPGSIFKTVTVAVCLKANEELTRAKKKPLFSPDEWIPTANGWFPGRSTPLKDARVHHYLNLDLGMQKSSNVYMARLVHRVIETMGEEWYRKTLTELFGFGKKTGIELPAESPGSVPTPGKLHPNGKPEWSVPTPYSLAIGHNILVTGLQLVKVYAMIANGGLEVQPHIIQKIVRRSANAAEQILVDKTGNRASKQLFSPASCQVLVRSMKFVTQEGGTSKRANIPGYTEAGKSGTAEKIVNGVYAKDKNLSSFIGFAPAKNPRFVLLVSLDEPEVRFIQGVGKHQMGGVCATPIFKEIALKSLQYLGVEPDDPCGYPAGDPRRDSKKADWALELEALKKAYDLHNGVVQ